MLDHARLEARVHGLDEPVVLAGDQPNRFRAGHFTWQVQRQLQAIVGKDVDLTTAGYRVITTLDWRAQKLAQRWITAAVISPNITKSWFVTATMNRSTVQTRIRSP